AYKAKVLRWCLLVLPGELDLHLSCVNLAPFKVSIYTKGLFFHHRFASIPCDKAYISGAQVGPELIACPV
ncbi:hypothetical protein LEMLEM_LOCUS1309, partial [Lemmus lemmus]